MKAGASKTCSRIRGRLGPQRGKRDEFAVVAERVERRRQTAMHRPPKAPQPFFFTT